MARRLQSQSCLPIPVSSHPPQHRIVVLQNHAFDAAFAMPSLILASDNGELIQDFFNTALHQMVRHQWSDKKCVLLH